MHGSPHTHAALPPCLPCTQAGQAWAELEELEAAEAALSRAAEAAQALAPLCFERRGRGPQHQDAAALCFQLQLERLGVALRLGQEVGRGWIRGAGERRLWVLGRRVLPAAPLHHACNPRRWSLPGPPPARCRCWWAAC